MSIKIAATAHKCPGCGLRMPVDNGAAYDGYYDCSPECWGVYAEVLGYQFGDAVVFGQVHQMTVDAYALQHAGGPHPDKSVAIHFAGLHAAFELAVQQTQIPLLLQQLARQVDRWPSFTPPLNAGPMTVFEIAIAETATEHIARAKRWATFVWEAWSAHHDDIAKFVALHRPS